MTETPIARLIRAATGRKFLIGLTLGALTVLLAGRFNRVGGEAHFPWDPPGDSHSALSESNDASLKGLRDALATEVQAREELTARIDHLDAKISRLVLANPSATATSLAALESSAEHDGSEEAQLSGPQANSIADANLSKFNHEALLALGIHSRDVDRLHDFWVNKELEAAEISDQALREGWFQQQRHKAEMIRLEVNLRQDLQDEDYDRYLYALGTPNRLEAGEILTGSFASEAGLRRGDVILRYDDVRLFRPSDLLVASSKGESGRSVAMEIIRDGRRRTLYVRRGPLGALIKKGRAEPLSD